MGQLVVALDVDSAREALALAEKLRHLRCGFKVGSRLFVAEGPPVVRTLVDSGLDVFLDLKFHDIPQTVASAVTAATRLGVSMLTVHASGGTTMLRAAAEARSTASGRGGASPKLVAVTVLTSFGDRDLPEIGVTHPLAKQVQELAKMAHACGIDGVVSSPREIRILRDVYPSSFLIVTPGIRSSSSTDRRDDQRRTATAAEAIAAGASHIVVGRPILAAPDPVKAAETIVEEILSASRLSPLNQ